MRYINYIPEKYNFSGCEGDFEQIAKDADDITLKNYIEYFNKQLNLAEAELKRRKDERNAGKTEEE